MRKILLFGLSVIYTCVVYGQVLTASDFVHMSSLTEGKFSNYVSKAGFFKGDRNQQYDTLQQNFYLNNKKIKQLKDSASRYVQELFYDNKIAFSYSTSSYDECKDIIRSLKDKGFYCEEENVQAPFLYQKNDISVLLTSKQEDTVNYFSFFIKKDILPSPAKINYAEDFLGFQSHENLEYVFGKANVQKDIYYFSDSDAVRCSILFPNTNRQIIFVWKDEVNRCTIKQLLVGNSLRGKKSLKYDNPVSENVWTLKNGLRTNMSLAELIQMNDGDFDFYGWNSPYPGIVFPAKKGNIDFKNTGVILSCLNCSTYDLENRELISADTAIQDNKRLFVLAVIVMPPPQKEDFSALHK